MNYFTDREFQEADILSEGLGEGTYDSCIFRGLDLSGAFLDGRNFMDCEFHDCNLSNANIGGAQWNGVRFTGCKMVGLRFETCGEFITDLRFETCLLDFSTFSGISMPGTVYADCSLMEVDFSHADLSGVMFTKCNLARAIFYQTHLEAADFSTAYGYSLDPEQNRLRKARFSTDGLAGLLGRHGIIIE